MFQPQSLEQILSTFTKVQKQLEDFMVFHSLEEKKKKENLKKLELEISSHVTHQEKAKKVAQKMREFTAI